MLHFVCFACFFVYFKVKIGLLVRTACTSENHCFMAVKNTNVRYCITINKNVLAEFLAYCHFFHLKPNKVIQGFMVKRFRDNIINYRGRW